MGKHEKKQRKKRLKKQIEGLTEQQEKHQEKLKVGKFREDYRKDTTPEYWITEMKHRKQKIEEKMELLKKLEGKKKGKGG